MCHNKFKVFFFFFCPFRLKQSYMCHIATRIGCSLSANAANNLASSTMVALAALNGILTLLSIKREVSRIAKTQTWIFPVPKHWLNGTVLSKHCERNFSRFWRYLWMSALVPTSNKVDNIFFHYRNSSAEWSCQWSWKIQFQLSWFRNKLQWDYDPSKSNLDQRQNNF